MVKAYVDAYRFLGDESYLSNAQSLANYLLKKRFVKGQLRRVDYQDTNGFLDDYAYTAEALIALYQVTFDIKWLNQANLLAVQIFKNFKQNEQGFFYYSSNNQLFINSHIEITDGVLPSSNAVFATILYDLGVLFENVNYTQTAKKITDAMSHKINSATQAQAYYYWGNVLMKQQRPPFEVCIVGKEARNKLNYFAQFDNVLLLGATHGEPLPLLKDKTKKGATMIYVCQNSVCKLPTTDVTKVIKIITE
jgi:uncharacterized protein